MYIYILVSCSGSSKARKFFNNVRDTNFFTKSFTNCWYGKWFLVNEKVILMVDLDENQ